MEKFTQAQFDKLTDYEKLMFVNYLLGQVHHLQKMSFAQSELINSMASNGFREKHHMEPFSVVEGGK